MDNEVRPTWKLAWGMWWRMFLITLGIGVIVAAIVAAVMGLSFIPWLVCWWILFVWLLGGVAIYYWWQRRDIVIAASDWIPAGKSAAVTAIEVFGVLTMGPSNYIFIQE